MINLDQDFDSETDLADLFKPLANEIRMEILWTLAQSTGPLPFTTLQEEIGIEDSGNFHYHLSQINNHFIHNTAEGYELRYPGRALIRAIKHGGIAIDPELPPRPIDLPCPFCGYDQEFSYADETLKLRCTNCSGVVGEPYDSGTIMSYEFPPGGLHRRTEREVATAAHRLYDAEIIAMVGGVCPRCSGKVEAELSICERHDTQQREICEACQTRYMTWAKYSCTSCGFSRQFPSWFKALYLPEVIAFFHDAAGFTRKLPFPKFLTDDGTELRDVSESIRSMDPIEAITWLNIDDAYCKVVVNENLDVTVEEKRMGMPEGSESTSEQDSN